ncbi:XdhC family protein [Klenkia terrae]|uniref:XdhC family protein n=1 Tax=Klenkia terrae TaxID=1052259 RepID=UPI003615A1A9
MRRRAAHPGLASIGLIGSAGKWARFRRTLLADGAPDPDRITCPIGLPELAGKEPAVIAVSVAAALLGAFTRVPS